VAEAGAAALASFARLLLFTGDDVVSGCDVRRPAHRCRAGGAGQLDNRTGVIDWTV